MNTTALVHPMAHHKIHRAHYDRLAAVYVRQSTPQQLIRHQESTRLQYGLVERALRRLERPVNVFCPEPLKFRHMSSDIVAVGIESLALQHRIEDAEEG